MNPYDRVTLILTAIVVAIICWFALAWNHHPYP